MVGTTRGGHVIGQGVQTRHAGHSSIQYRNAEPPWPSPRPQRRRGRHASAIEYALMECQRSLQMLRLFPLLTVTLHVKHSWPLPSITTVLFANRITYTCSPPTSKKMSFTIPEPSGFPLRPRPPQMSSLPRPPMPMPLPEHLHRQMPASPFIDMNSRDSRDSRDPRVMSSPYETRSGMEEPDFFCAMTSPMGPRHSGGTFPPGFEPDSMMSGPEQYLDELVRR